MSTGQWFSIVLSALGLLFTVLCVLAGLTLRAIVKFTRAEDALARADEKLGDIAGDIKELVDDKRRDHDAINRRLTWLERRQHGRGPGDP